MKLSGPGLGLTKKKGLRDYCQKKKAEKEEAKKQYNAFMKLWPIEKDVKHVEGVAVRKEKKACLQEIKKLRKQGSFVSLELLESILDPELI